MKRQTILLLLLLLAGLGATAERWWRSSSTLPAATVVSPGGPSGPMTLLSDGYRMERIYKSMEGPASAHGGLRLPSGSGADFVWLTGIDTEIVDARSLEPMSSEFLCHSNLTFDAKSGSPELHNKFFGGKTHLEWRLFSLVPGRFSIHLPEGFGIPIPKGAALDYYTMSLNQNVRDRVIESRMKTKIFSVPRDQATSPMKALFRRALYVLQPQTCQASDPRATTMVTSQHVGAGCADTCSVNASATTTVGAVGEGQTLHWLVPPGRQTYKTEITPQLNLPFDTTIHYATFHSHHYATFMELLDLTTGESVFRLASRDRRDRLGVEHVEEIKSVAGIPIHRSHRYELTIEYDNTTAKDIDAMGILYVYCHEKDFDAGRFTQSSAVETVAAARR